jgi:hypothetical protein
MDDPEVVGDWRRDLEGRDLEALCGGVFCRSFWDSCHAYFWQGNSWSFLGVLLLSTILGNVVWFSTIETEFFLEAALLFFFGEGAMLLGQVLGCAGVAHLEGIFHCRAMGLYSGLSLGKGWGII